MATIHPTAVLDGDVRLAEDVVVGPGTVIDGTLGPVVVEPGTRIIGQAWLNGPLTLGSENLLYPGVCLGFAPQSVDFDPRIAGHGVVIGDRNRFREGVTVHRAMTDDGPTRIGDDNFLMNNAHVGHDCRVSDHCTLASGVLLGGHVTLEDRVNIGGNTAVHQFVRVGQGVLMSGAIAASHDVPPYFMMTGINFAGSLNRIGLRRHGFTSDQIDAARWVYRVLYRQGLPVTDAVERLHERGDEPMVAMYLDFIERSKRGIVKGYAQEKRRTVDVG